MNRKNRRDLAKNLRNQTRRNHASDVLGKLGDDIADVIQDGDHVILNSQRIMERPEYSRSQEGYRAFVEANRGKVFIARSYHPRKDGFSALLELEGVENWLFWYGDLIHVQDIPNEGE